MPTELQKQIVASRKVRNVYYIRGALAAKRWSSETNGLFCNRRRSRGQRVIPNQLRANKNMKSRLFINVLIIVLFCAHYMRLKVRS